MKLFWRPRVELQVVPTIIPLGASIGNTWHNGWNLVFSWEIYHLGHSFHTCSKILATDYGLPWRILYGICSTIAQIPSCLRLSRQFSHLFGRFPGDNQLLPRAILLHRWFGIRCFGNQSNHSVDHERACTNHKKCSNNIAALCLNRSFPTSISSWKGNLWLKSY